jgi:hypothetical protein
MTPGAVRAGVRSAFCAFQACGFDLHQRTRTPSFDGAGSVATLRDRFFVYRLSRVRMSPGTRACIAYVAGRIITGTARSYVYDHAESKHVNVGGTINGNRIGLYDYERGCNFHGALPHLRDDGTGAGVSLQIDGNRFSGHDHGSGHAFSGSVDGPSISVYDHVVARHFAYSL